MSVFTSYIAEDNVVPSSFASKRLSRDYSIVLKGFEYYVGNKEDDVVIRIEPGYITDGATIPRVLSKYIPAWGKWGQASIVHDYLCETLSVLVHGVKTPITRRQGDRIFLEAMGVLGVPWYQRIVFYAGVRLYSVFVARCKAENPPLKVSTQEALRIHFELTGHYDL